MKWDTVTIISINSNWIPHPSVLGLLCLLPAHLGLERWLAVAKSCAAPTLQKKNCFAGLLSLYADFLWWGEGAPRIFFSSKPMASHMLGKHSATEVICSPSLDSWIVAAQCIVQAIISKMTLWGPRVKLIKYSHFTSCGTSFPLENSTPFF